MVARDLAGWLVAHGGVNAFAFRTLTYTAQRRTVLGFGSETLPVIHLDLQRWRKVLGERLILRRWS